MKRKKLFDCGSKSRGGSRWVAKLLQESILIVFDFIRKASLSDKNFATLLDPPMKSTAQQYGGERSFSIKGEAIYLSKNSIGNFAVLLYIVMFPK